MSSICRLNNWSERCENILNEQINLEYWASLQYHTMFAYFDRDYVGLKNIAEFFNKSSHEEREHAHKFIKYQNMRGGKVVIGDVKDFEFDVDIDSIFSSNNNTPNEENTNNFHNHDVLEGFNKALEMEQKVYLKLLEVHKVGEEENDPQFCDFIEGEFLSEQIEAINQLGVYISQIKRIGLNGHGLWDFDKNFKL